MDCELCFSHLALTQTSITKLAWEVSNSGRQVTQESRPALLDSSYWFNCTVYQLSVSLSTLRVTVLPLQLSRFSRVWLCATPWTAAHQAPPSLGFSRQEHWSSCHFLLQCMKVKSESEVAQSCPTLSNPMDLGTGILSVAVISLCLVPVQKFHQQVKAF